MAKERVIRSRITIEVDPKVRVFLEGWAKEEGRPLSNFLRRILSGRWTRSACLFLLVSDPKTDCPDT
jgi:hypothetical protein